MSLTSPIPVSKWFPEARAIREVLSHRPYLTIYVISAPLVAFTYALLLPGLLFETFAFWVLRYLTPTEALFALAMGVLLPLALVMSAYLWRHPRCEVEGQSPNHGPFMALLLSIVPNALCCTPIIPVVLALFVSGSTLISISAPVQYYLGTYAAILYTLSALALWWSIRRVSVGLTLPELGD
jgi:phosphoglycerol transferase MdoB-like AlkP superfamily enzyme